ncbi:MAG: glycoside hydrolase family 31 protein [Myxococcota bacterium]|nr:glycoside hydrolase family 31 protein [Myxococcota bacterium]
MSSKHKAFRFDDGRLIALGREARLELTPYTNGVIRLSYHRLGQSSTRRSWVIGEYPETDDMIAAYEAEQGVEMLTRSLIVAVERDTLKVQVGDPERNLVIDDGPDGGWVDLGSEGVALRRRILPGERYYGLGEKTGGLNKLGRRWRMHNHDAFVREHGGYPPGADPLYCNIPFYIVLRAGSAHGIYVDSAYPLNLDLGAEQPGRSLIHSEGGELDTFILPGPSIAEVLERFTSLTGRMPLPARWALGYHQSRWGYANAEALEGIADELRQRQLHGAALWLDIQHQQGFRSFTWDEETFPEPKALIERLRKQGFELVLIQDAGIKAEEQWDVYESGVWADAFLRKQDGELYRERGWAEESVYPDFSHPSARQWWSEQVEAMARQGVGGVWIDLNEPTVLPASGGPASPPDALPVHGDGEPTRMHELHNVYALLQAEASYAGMLAAQPQCRPFVLTRAGFAGVQRFAALWTGDVSSTWAGLRETLPMLLGLGLSGVAFVGSDVGGFSGSPSPELYARWMALGCVSPFFRCHYTKDAPAQEPWAFGEEIEAICRRLINTRLELMPYLYSAFEESARTGRPVLRPMIFEFQGDDRFLDVDDQAMLGAHLLVAPVLDPGISAREVVLPPGLWTYLPTGTRYQGPDRIFVDAELDTLPLFVRGGTVLPRCTVDAVLESRYPLCSRLDVYPGDVETVSHLYEDRGNSSPELEHCEHAQLRFITSSDQDTLRLCVWLETQGSAPHFSFDLYIHQLQELPEIVAVNGVELEVRLEPEESGEHWAWLEEQRALRLRLERSRSFIVELVFAMS